MLPASMERKARQGQNSGSEVTFMAKRSKADIEAELEEWNGHRKALQDGLPVCDQKIAELKGELEASKAVSEGAVEPETLKAIIKRETTGTDERGVRHGTAAGVLAIRTAGGKTAGS
jgi:hypothetical protein